MAKKTTPKPTAPDIDPEAQYRVTLLRAVPRPGRPALRPQDDLTMKGRMLVELVELGDAVKEWEPV
jgi:hypothetical protein